MTRAWILFALAACDGELTAEGTHHHYVIDKLQLPTSADDVPRLAIDLDRNGTKDNKVGGAFAALAAAGFDANIGENFDIAAGNVLLLVDFQTIDYTEAPASGIRVLFGTNPSPTPCTTATDCGHHLTGSGSFDLGFQSQDAPQLVGTIQGGTFASAAGSFSIQISVGGGSQSVFAHEVALVGARVEVTAAGRTQVRQVSCGDSYCSQRPLTLHFGLGAADPATVEVRVRWADGTVQRFHEVKTRRRAVLRREEGRSQ